MKNLFQTILFIFVVTLSFSSPLRSQEEKAEIEISKIKIEGLRTLSIDQIKNSMATEFPSIKPWVKNPEFDERTLKDDILRIKDLLESSGYYSSNVDYELKFNEKNNKVQIHIYVDQGDPILLNNLVIQISEEYEEDFESNIVKILPIKLGEIFSVNKYEKSKTVISQFFANSGYPNAKIKSEATISRRDKEATANFFIEPGNKYTFGEILIVGATDIDENLILREITYKKGDQFNLKDISNSQENIFKLSFFKSVIVDTEFDDENLNVKTVYTLSERKLRTVRLGLGAGTEDILRGQVSYSQRNFLGGARTLELGSKVSFITQNFQMVLRQPYFFARENELRGRVNLERNDLPGFVGESIDSEIRFSRNIYSFLSSYVATELIFAQIDSEANSTPLVSSQENVTLFLFTGGLRYDTTDDFVDPTEGVFATAFIESSFDGIFSDESYIKSIFEFKTYRKYKSIVFAKRFQIGAIQPFGATDDFEVPVFRRFFAGGSTSMRGFPFQRLGPLDDDEDPLGGNSILIGNFEARIPVLKKVGTVLFLDYGNVYSENFNYDLNDLRYAVGAGLRYNTIVGPVRLDLGYALNPVDEINRLQVFVSIGQAF